MSRQIKALLTLVVFVSSLTGCTMVSKGTDESVNDEQSRVNLEKRYKDEVVPVATAILMTRSAYILGCTEAFISQGIKGKHKECIQNSKENIRKDILPIFDQDGTAVPALKSQ